jgi:hypothetical protein
MVYGLLLDRCKQNLKTTTTATAVITDTGESLRSLRTLSYVQSCSLPMFILKKQLSLSLTHSHTHAHARRHTQKTTKTYVHVYNIYSINRIDKIAPSLFCSSGDVVLVLLLLLLLSNK